MFFFLSRQGPRRMRNRDFTVDSSSIRRSNSFSSATTSKDAMFGNVHQDDIKIICWVFSSFMDENRTIIIIRPKKLLLGMLQLLLCNESKCVVDNATFLPHLSGRGICISIVMPPRRHVKAYDCCIPPQQQEEQQQKPCYYESFVAHALQFVAKLQHRWRRLVVWAGAKTRHMHVPFFIPGWSSWCAVYGASIRNIQTRSPGITVSREFKPFKTLILNQFLLDMDEDRAFYLRHPPLATIKTERFCLWNLIAHEHKTHYDMYVYISGPIAAPCRVKCLQLEQSLCTMEMRMARQRYHHHHHRTSSAYSHHRDEWYRKRVF